MTAPVALTPEQATADALASLKAAGIRGAKVFSENGGEPQPWHAGFDGIAQVRTEVTVRRAADKYPALEALLLLPGGLLYGDRWPRQVQLWRRRDPACGREGCDCVRADACRLTEPAAAAPEPPAEILHYLPIDAEDGDEFACRPQHRGTVTATTSRT
jgi:hypothetical protein